MISIALVGAPGSGKTVLAHRIKAMTEEPTFEIIDGYADEVARETNLALGVYATYIGNTIVLGERLKREIGAIKAERDYIVCGTLVETATYASINGATYERGSSQDEQFRTRLFMNQLGIIFRDMFFYDHVFYLPVRSDDDTLLPGLDAQIHQALEQFHVPYVTVEGDRDAQRDQVLTILNATDTLETTSSD